MKIAFDIDEEEMKQSILGVLVKQGVEEASAIFQKNDHYSFIKRLYRDDMQKSVREMLKAHEAEIIDRAVVKAAEMITRKAVPKLMERMGEDDA